MHHPLQTMSEQSLQVAEQKVVQFLSDELVAVRARDGNIYVSVNHLTKALGLNRRGAVQRIERQPVLFKGFCYGPVETAGGRQQLGLLRVDLVSLWLAGIETSRVKEEIREKLERYQEEAAKVLWEAFQDGRLTTDVSFDDLLQTDSPAAQAYKMALAMLQMARQQLLLEGRIHEHEMRLERIESTLGDPGRYVTPEQASQISQAVKAVALVLSKQTRRNEYGAVYGELYRKFGITGYKLLPARQFDEAITFLTEWHRSLTDDAPF
ncbi:MAG: ORF6C domain-containing protein [Ardenticatenaceae bacterium]|nr:ORF6C domain-containing protein [Ardenticatenaceae bacterium]